MSKAGVPIPGSMDDMELEELVNLGEKIISLLSLTLN